MPESTALPQITMSTDTQMFSQPFPAYFHKLSWHERRHLKRMQADQEKALKQMAKAQRQWEKSQAIEARDRYKAEVKAKKKELKWVFMLPASHF